ncbi:hypothetical protein HY932_00675 [Candidatus Falkowbacteria bacterium]|nr:hypothetical protein [Candidatus Falkowbacteria bacterium]
MKTNEKVAVFVLVVILGGGFAIYGINRLRGIDLSKPPHFDLPEFIPEIDLPTTNVESQQNNSATLNEQTIESIKEKLQALQTDAQNKIFFKIFFKQSTPEQTEKFINNFLADFPDLQKYPLNTKVVQGDYAAVLDIGKDVEKIKPTLDKLEKEFGNVVEIKLSQQ